MGVRGGAFFDGFWPKMQSGGFGVGVGGGKSHDLFVLGVCGFLARVLGFSWCWVCVWTWPLVPQARFWNFWAFLMLGGHVGTWSLVSPAPGVSGRIGSVILAWIEEFSGALLTVEYWVAWRCYLSFGWGMRWWCHALADSSLAWGPVGLEWSDSHPDFLRSLTIWGCRSCLLYLRTMAIPSWNWELYKRGLPMNELDVDVWQMAIFSKQAFFSPACLGTSYKGNS